MGEVMRRRGRFRRFVQQLPLLIGLVALWMLLWGEVTLLSLVSGILVAIVVTSAFYLPPVILSGRFNLFWAIVFVLRFLWQIIVSSVQVAWYSFQPKALDKSAIIEVDLHTRSDFVMSITAIAVSLVPGSLVLEIDRERALLFLHVLAARDAEGVEKARRSALSLEAGIIRAVGSRADLARVRS
jgi:multicomponent Na+:H+ antiporter subunit E